MYKKKEIKELKEVIQKHPDTFGWILSHSKKQLGDIVYNFSFSKLGINSLQ